MSASPASASTSTKSATTTTTPAPPPSSSQSLDLQLLAAIRDGKGFEQVKSLLDQGARVNSAAFKSNRNTALHYSARFGHASTTQLLLKRGALPNVKNANHWTPLHEAAHRNFEKVAKLLLQHGAQVNTRGMGAFHD